MMPIKQKEKHKLKITKELVHQKIREYEMEAGESFFDGAFAVKPLTFMSWCLGRKYITPEQYDDWLVAYINDDLEGTDENYFIYNSQGEYGASFAPVVVEEWSEESQEKADLILGEFISESKVYRNRFREFMIEEGLIGENEVLEKEE